ncbi:MAG: hypothetical protein K2I79_03360, partial [Clostridia bacterium]|nr:hypothetical protein [Clostridia bacterium]
MDRRLLKRTVIIICALAVAIGALFAVACTVTPVKIETPILSYSSYLLSWNECKGANLYAVTICDTGCEFEEFTNYVISTYTELISLEGKRIR